LNVQGEQNVFWETPIKWFAKSSGTTNAKSKFIPVSNEALEDCHQRQQRLIVSLFKQQCENSELLPARVYAWEEALRFEDNNTFWDLSAILIENAYLGVCCSTPVIKFR
jgi:hypothetical protein